MGENRKPPAPSDATGRVTPTPPLVHRQENLAQRRADSHLLSGRSVGWQTEETGRAGPGAAQVVPCGFPVGPRADTLLCVDLDSLFENRLDVPPHPDAEAVRPIPAGGGVYALSDEEDRLILLAAGEGLRRIIAHRLAPPPQASRKRADLKAIARRIRWRQTGSPFETMFEFHRIARALYPDRYGELLAFGPAWMVHVDLDLRPPRLAPVKYLQPRGTHLGPLPTRASAEKLIETLEDLFDLCRYPHILELAPHGQPCAYFEMGKCPAPCAGRIPLDRYRSMMIDALAFASGCSQAFTGVWSDQMRALAARQEFEQANRFKQKVQRARVLAGENYRFLRPMEDFNYLVLQRGEGRTQVKAFFVRSSGIEPGPSVARKSLGTAAGGWVEQMRSRRDTGTDTDRTVASEHIWLAAHFLFKGEEASGLFLGPDEWPEPQRWLPKVVEKLLQTRRTGSTPRVNGAGSQAPVETGLVIGPFEAAAETREKNCRPNPAG